jgi:hypothetical protein
MPVVSFFWSLAILSKLQVLPFFLAALGLPLLITLFRRRWKSARLFGGCLIGSIVFKLGFDYFLARLWPVSAVTGLAPLLALVFFPDIRLTVMVETLQYVCRRYWGCVGAFGVFSERKAELKAISTWFVSRSWF